MKYRLSDTPENIEQEMPFRERHALLDPWKILSAIILSFIVILVLIYQSDTIGDEITLVSLFTVFAGLIIYFGIVMFKTRNVVLGSEFTNSLLAGANNADVEFTLITKTSGEVVYLSPGCKKYFRKDHDLKNASFEDIIDFLGIEDMAKIKILSSFQANTPSSYDVQLFDAFGFIQDLFLVLKPIGRPKGYMMLKGIKAFEESGEESNDSKVAPYMVQILDALPLPAYISTDSGTLLHANNDFSEMLGYEDYEIANSGLNLKDLFFGNGVGEDEDVENWGGMVAMRHKNQEMPLKRTINHKNISLRNDGKSIVFGFVEPSASQSMSNSTDPLEIDQAMSDVWIKALENAPISIAFLDKNGRVNMSNLHFREMAGEKMSSGWNIRDMISSDQVEKLNEKILEVASTISEDVAPVDIKLAGDEEKNVLLYLSPLGDDSDGYIAHMVDTTSQKKFEQKMVQSQKMQAVGQLAGGIAHDFNNLLTAMTGFCDLLLIRHPAGDPSFPDIMQIKHNSNRAANLVRQLLAFSRKQTLQPEVLDVTDSLADLSNLITRLIGENIEFNIRHGSNLSHVRVDKVQLEQVIINLAVNARDAMAGNGTLTFRTSNVKIDQTNPLDPRLKSAAEDDVIVDGKYVLIEVSDTGEGIDKKLIEHIFDPFFSTKDVGEGTGLGLATVYGIVKQTGGYIYVASEVGVGTTFSIYLKAVEEEEVQEYQKKKLLEEKSADADLTGRGTILLVEDEAPVRMFSVRALANKGYDVLEAENAQIGIQIMEEKGDSIDMIVTDVMMPGLDGPAMIKKIRENYPDIKVVYVSGYGEDAFIKTYGEQRDFNFLAKPYSLKDLAAKVKDVIGK